MVGGWGATPTRTSWPSLAKTSYGDNTRSVSDLTYSGYIASGEEVTAGEADLLNASPPVRR